MAGHHINFVKLLLDLFHSRVVHSVKIFDNESVILNIWWLHFFSAAARLAPASHSHDPWSLMFGGWWRYQWKLGWSSYRHKVPLQIMHTRYTSTWPCGSDWTSHASARRQHSKLCHAPRFTSQQSSWWLLSSYDEGRSRQSYCCYTLNYLTTIFCFV